MATNKLPDGKKLIVELDNEGFRNVFFKNKWGDFLDAIMKTGIGRIKKFPKGVRAFLVDESSGFGFTNGGGDSPPMYITPVTEEDKARAVELANMKDVPDTEGLPPFEPFGPFKASETPGAEEQIEDK